MPRQAWNKHILGKLTQSEGVRVRVFVLLSSHQVMHSLSLMTLWKENQDPAIQVQCDDRAQHSRELHALAGGAVWFGLLFYMRGTPAPSPAQPSPAQPSAAQYTVSPAPLCRLLQCGTVARTHVTSLSRYE